MNLALNNLQRLVYHKTKPNQTKPVMLVILQNVILPDDRESVTLLVAICSFNYCVIIYIYIYIYMCVCVCVCVCVFVEVPVV